jgi:hypothetical protein
LDVKLFIDARVRCVWAAGGCTTHLGTGTLITMCSESGEEFGSGERGFSSRGGGSRIWSSFGAEVGFRDEDAFVVEADDARGVVWVVGARRWGCRGDRAIDEVTSHMQRLDDQLTPVSRPSPTLPYRARCCLAHTRSGLIRLATSLLELSPTGSSLMLTESSM